MILLHRPLVAEPGHTRTAPPPATPEQAHARPPPLRRHPERHVLIRHARLQRGAGSHAGRGPPRGHDRRSHPRAAQGFAAMIPDTKNGLPAMACVSAMQKAIRRGMEREAMEFACELMHTSIAFHSMVCNMLVVICHEYLHSSATP